MSIPDRLALIIAPDPGGVILARAFVGSVLRVIDTDQRRVDDARLIVSELATALVESGLEDAITIEAVIARDRVVLGVGSDGEMPALSDLRRTLVEAVAAGTVETGESGWRIRLGTR